jgi:hypothetical protein
MRLPIPFEWSGQVIREVEVGAPKAGLLADTREVADQGKMHAAMYTLAAGSILDAEGITDRNEIKRMTRDMPYRSAEFVALSAVLTISPDDGFEGVYVCPRCGEKIITEYNPENDTRDFVSDLEVGVLEEPELFSLDLDVPVTFTSQGEVIDEVRSMELRYPTMADCMAAERRAAGKDAVRLQFAIYAQALVSVNGKQINDTWKVGFGTQMFDRLDVKTDLRALSEAMGRYGLQSEIEKRCISCGKVWKAPVNTSNFFVSALRSE